MLDPSAKVRLPIPRVPPSLTSIWQRIRAFMRPPASIIPMSALEQAHTRGSLTHVPNGGLDVTGVYEGDWPTSHDYIGVLGMPKARCTPRWILILRWYGQWIYLRSRERQRRAMLIAAPFGFSPTNNNGNGNGNGNGGGSCTDGGISSITKPSSYMYGGDGSERHGGILNLARRYGLELTLTLLLLAWMWRRLRAALLGLGV
jgi:hypothetical protein